MLGDQIVHETIDGETVVINLDSGSYYSLEGSGADLWSRLLAGESLNDSGTVAMLRRLALRSRPSTGNSSTRV